MKALLVAATFLTRVPCGVSMDASAVERATRWFPLVGAALGGAAALVATALAMTPTPSLLASLVLVALGAWVTGAIHLDGLADMADGFAGGKTPENALRIMRDPAVGSIGALALMLVLGFKVAALATLLEREIAVPVLVAAPTVSRWTIVALGLWLPYARPGGGLGRFVTRQRDRAGFVWATVVALAVTALALREQAIVVWLLAVATLAAVGRGARRRLGGVTGDVFGASVELTETAVLLGGAVLC